VNERPTGHPGRWWSRRGDRFVCELCPRECALHPGQRGACFVRAADDDGIVLTTYGRSSGFCIDPIEKKPLNHFLPGTSVLSFGTAGCNLACKFCQNHDISKARHMDSLMARASPQGLADAAVAHGCRSIAFTYNDPVIFAEYALDVAAACRAVGVRSVAVTAGWIADGARAEFFGGMDAANVDLKAFTESFYRRLTGSTLGPVLDTLRYLHHETAVWTEITTLLIPGENDSDAELHALCAWVRDELSPDVPLHFSAYHPDHRLTTPSTPKSTLVRARRIAQEEGLRYVYLGNVHDAAGDTTTCPACSRAVIERDWYELTAWRMQRGGRCPCGEVLPGVFEDQPGSWGRRRLPIVVGA